MISRHAFLLLIMSLYVMKVVAIDQNIVEQSQDIEKTEEKSTNDMDVLADKIINDYYPYKLIAPYVLKNEKDGSPSDEEQNKHARTVEKWLLIGFCSICILAMIVCVVVLVRYKIKKNKAAQENPIGKRVSFGSNLSNSRQKQPRQGSNKSRTTNSSRDSL